MALTIKQLYAGQLGASVVVLLAGSTTKSTLIKNIMLVNTDTAVRTVQFQATKTGTGYNVCPIDLAIPPKGQIILDSEITLANNGAGTPVADTLKGGADAGGKVDCVINGMERDL